MEEYGALEENVYSTMEEYGALEENSRTVEEYGGLEEWKSVGL